MLLLQVRCNVIKRERDKAVEYKSHELLVWHK